MNLKEQIQAEIKSQLGESDDFDLDQAFNDAKPVDESVMSELDILAKEAKDLKSFVKAAYKEFDNLPKSKDTIKWLSDTYKSTNESVVNTHINEAVKLAHVYDKDGSLYGTGELVKTKGKKSLIRWDGSREEWYPSNLVKLVESVVTKSETLTERQLKGLDGIDDKTLLTKISYQQKLKIIQGTGNNISFKVPKGLTRNFWQVFSKGKIKTKKSLSGNKVYFLPGKIIDSPHYTSEKELVDNVLWDKMEDIRRFNESVVNEEQLEEKLITFSNRAPYGQIVFMAGGAGSGKGFAISNFIDSAGFKIRDVDEMKKAVGSLDKLGKLSIEKWYKKFSKNLKEKDLTHVDTYVKDRKLTIKALSADLKNPNNVSALHFIVKAMGIKDAWITNMLMGKTNKDVLPNLLFDITAKDVSDITGDLKSLLKAGYESKNVHLIWVLTNYSIAVTNNAGRDRVVPDDTMLATHEGASKTLWSMLTQALPKGLNGRIDVILNNKENTIFYNKSGEANTKTTKAGDVDKRSNISRKQTVTKQTRDYDDGALTTTHKLEKVKFVADFLSLPVKKQGGGITPEGVWHKILFKWIEKNAPKTTDLSKDMES